MQQAILYKKENTTGASNNGNYTIIYSSLDAHIAFAIDFSKRIKLGYKLISHAGNEQEISAVWEIP